MLFDSCLGTHPKRLSHNVFVWSPSYIQQIQGMACHLEDDRKEVLLEIAEYLNDNYVQYGRGVRYLQQLAGVTATPTTPPPRLSFLQNSDFGVQRGGMVLTDPEPHVMHTMSVRFHRYG